MIVNAASLMGLEIMQPLTLCTIQISFCVKGKVMHTGKISRKIGQSECLWKTICGQVIQMISAPINEMTQ